MEPAQRSNPILQAIPGSLIEFKLIAIPNGEIQIDGRRLHATNLAFGETEVAWDLYDVWAFGLDRSEEQEADGCDAVARPSKPYGAPDRGFGHSGYPALSMTYHAAEQFCRWLSKVTGRPYRLPSAAEWEYAARAGDLGSPQSLDESAWHWDNADNATHRCGTKAPNAWGLHDMLGNVAEWTLDEKGTPVTCGGHFLDKPDAIGYDRRIYQPTKWSERDPQNPKSKWWLPDAPFIGFRLVLELER